MRITIDSSGFRIEREAQQNKARQIGEVVWLHVRAGAFRIKRNVQIRMPVDTGRARASWGNVPSVFPAQAGDGIWQENEGSFTIVQGSAVDYIEKLNEGSSMQAPAGFIDAVAAAEIRRFEDDLAEALVRIL